VNSASVLTGEDLEAINTVSVPQNVVPQLLSTPEMRGGRTKFEVLARSYTVIQRAL
jgi:alpha-L-arabinofuranosidase